MPETIVHLRLLRGHSTQRAVTLHSRCRRALFRVGSARECNWRVHGPGIARHHLMLLWKGGGLTVVDVGAGDLWVDERAFVLSAPCAEGSIRFGSGLIRVERRLSGAQNIAKQGQAHDTTQPG